VNTNDYPKTRQIMRVVAESGVEGITERGYALRDAARAAIEQMEDDAEELANALRDVLAGHPVRNADELIARYSPLPANPSPQPGDAPERTFCSNPITNGDLDG
jgi:hypothetical protein